MQFDKRIIKYLIIIVAILIIVFIVRLKYFKDFSGAIVSGAKEQASAYMAKGTSWLSSIFYSKLSGEVKDGGELIQNGINQEINKTKEKISEIKNYFSGIKDSILHPGENNNTNCPATSTK